MKLDCVKCNKCGKVHSVSKGCEPLSSHAVLGDGWRDCAKDLPDDRRDVIIGNANNKCVSVGWWNSEHNNGEGKWLIRTVHFDGEVTHWMELPDPPVFA